jgi:hypothetical protein
MTINELREFLDKEEARWTPEVEKYLGKFGDQPICLPAYHSTKDSEVRFRGWTPETIIWEDQTGLGFLMDVRDE